MLDDAAERWTWNDSDFARRKARGPGRFINEEGGSSNRKDIEFNAYVYSGVGTRSGVDFGDGDGYTWKASTLCVGSSERAW